MSAHPFGPEANNDIGQLSKFEDTVAAYCLARQRAQTYETARDAHPEVFTLADQSELTLRHVDQFKASREVLGQALVLKGSGALRRCIHALEAQSDG
jgi:hypothetical protein